jgi:fructan beta-fructosidase
VQENSCFSPGVQGESLEIIVAFEAAQEMAAEVFGVRVRTGGGAYTAAGYWTTRGLAYTDRLKSGNVAFHEQFPKENFSALDIKDGLVRLHLFVDRCSLELFANDGLVCFTELIFPGEDCLGVELFSRGGGVKVRELVIFEI